MIRGARDPFRDHDPFRLYVFVPAIMSAGLLFSIATLLRDAVAARGRSRAGHRARLDAAGTVAAVLGTPPSTRLGRSRSFYVLVGIAASLMAAYVIPGATLNYLRPNGYVGDIAWVLCLALGVGLTLSVIGAASLLSAADWPAVRPSLKWLATGGVDGAPGAARAGGPSAGLAAALLGAVGALTFVSVGVAVGRFRSFDEAVARDLRDLDLPWIVDLVGALGSTPVSLLLATAIGAVAVRCRTFAVAWVGTVLSTFAVDVALKRLVERPRPELFRSLEDSYPSGHLAQLVLLAVVAPVAIQVVSDRRLWSRLVGALLAVGAVIAAAERVHAGMHWPMDVVGGAALGLTAGLCLRWLVARRAWHQRCRRCPWSRSST